MVRARDMSSKNKERQMVALTNVQYQEKISVAEAAVAEMTDPQLRQVAFAKILEQLLSEDGGGSLSRRANRGTDLGVRRKVGSGGPISRIESLVAEDFFADARTLGDVQKELEIRGHRIPRTSLSGPLQVM